MKVKLLLIYIIFNKEHQIMQAVEIAQNVP